MGIFFSHFIISNIKISIIKLSSVMRKIRRSVDKIGTFEIHKVFLYAYIHTHTLLSPSFPTILMPFQGQSIVEHDRDARFSSPRRGTISVWNREWIGTAVSDLQAHHLICFRQAAGCEKDAQKSIEAPVSPRSLDV